MLTLFEYAVLIRIMIQKEYNKEQSNGDVDGEEIAIRAGVLNRTIFMLYNGTESGIPNGTLNPVLSFADHRNRELDASRRIVLSSLGFAFKRLL